MDWLNLIGAGSSLLGGLMSGGKDTTTTEQTSTPQVSAELDAEIQKIFAKIPGLFGREFPEFQGDRTAPQTESRDQMDPYIAAINNGGMMDRANGVNLYQNRINELMNMAPTQVSVPTLLGNNDANGVAVSGGYQGGDYTAMLPTTAASANTQSTETPPWLQSAEGA